MAGISPVKGTDAGILRTLPYRPTHLLIGAQAWAEKETALAERSQLAAQSDMRRYTEELTTIDLIWHESLENMAAIYSHLDLSPCKDSRARSTSAIEANLDALSNRLEQLGDLTTKDRFERLTATCGKRYLPIYTAGTWTLKLLGVLRELPEEVATVRQTIEGNLRRAQAVEKVAIETLENLYGAPKRFAHAYNRVDRAWQCVMHLKEHPEDRVEAMAQIRELVDQEVDFEAGLEHAFAEWEKLLLSLILPPEVLPTYFRWYVSVDWEKSARMQTIVETHMNTAATLSEKEDKLIVEWQKFNTRKIETLQFRHSVDELNRMVAEGDREIEEARKADKKAMVAVATSVGALALAIALPIAVPGIAGCALMIGSEFTLTIVAVGANKCIDDGD